MIDVNYDHSRDINKTLIKILCQQCNGFNVAHFNARSLKRDKLNK